MKTRCYNNKNKNFKWYGAKGIKLCDEWNDSFKSFEKWAYENGYQEGMTIDRKKDNKNYEPSNCQWITHSENSKKSATRDNFEKNKTIKLSSMDIIKIKEMYATGKYLQREIAKIYNVSCPTISVVTRC